MSKEGPPFDYGNWSNEEWPDVPDRWMAEIVLADLDYDAQLFAIQQAMQRNQLADTELGARIDQIIEFTKKKTGLRNEQAINELHDHYHQSVYQDAAHSMAAVGMIAPFLESVFHQAFLGIGREFYADSRLFTSHDRWAAADEAWDCHWVRRGGRWNRDVVAGIQQLATATELDVHLPSGYEQTISALFAYRNKMFHHGFEWPPVEREAFARRIEDEAWPSSWFEKATSGGKVWIHYVTDEFSDLCMRTANDVIDGIGTYCKQRTSRDNGGE